MSLFHLCGHDNTIWSKHFLQFLFIQFPGYTILGVLHLETCLSKGIANLVAGSPVFVSLGLGTQVEHHVDNLAVSFLTGIVVGSLLALQSQKVEGEKTHGVRKFLQVVGRDIGLMVKGGIDDMTCLEEITDDKLCLEVVVHRIIATLAQLCYELVNLLVALRWKTLSRVR